MNPMQTKLEQLFKEYISFKTYLENDSKETDKLKEEVAKKALELDSTEDQALLFFENIGEKDILKVDFLETKKRLFYFIESYKDFIEIPEEILNEFKDFEVKTVFSIINGEKQILDKELYNSHKTNYLEYCRQFNEQLANPDHQN